SEESDTASIDHLSDGDDEVLEVRNKKLGHASKKKATKMFDENSLTSIFSWLPKDEFNDTKDPKTDDQDKLSDQWRIHDLNIKWKLMRTRLGERFEGPEQLKRALAFYALANGYKLYYMLTSERSSLVQFRSLFWKSVKATYPAKFEKVMKEKTHKHLMERNPENGISECFNSLVIEARRKPIIDMLEDIRIGLMEIMQRMRENMMG
nr:cellulose synthase [Tanacetum cinerariifolium]